MKEEIDSSATDLIKLQTVRHKHLTICGSAPIFFRLCIIVVIFLLYCMKQWVVSID